MIFSGQKNATGHRTHHLIHSEWSLYHWAMYSYEKQKTPWHMTSPWATLLVSKIKMNFKGKFYDWDKPLQMSRSKKATEQHWRLYRSVGITHKSGTQVNMANLLFCFKECFKLYPFSLTPIPRLSPSLSFATPPTPSLSFTTPSPLSRYKIALTSDLKLY